MVTGDAKKVGRTFIVFVLGRIYGLRKQPTVCKATAGFQAKYRLRNERRNFTLTTYHYTDLGSASDWLK